MRQVLTVPRASSLVRLSVCVGATCLLTGCATSMFKGHTSRMQPLLDQVRQGTPADLALLKDSADSQDKMLYLARAS